VRASSPNYRGARLSLASNTTRSSHLKPGPRNAMSKAIRAFIARAFPSESDMKIASLLCLALIVFSLMLHAQEHSSMSSDEALILSLEKAWNLAEEHKDAHALDQLLASTLVYTEFDGSMMDKAQFLASVKNSSPEGDQFICEDLRVRVYADCAIVNGMYREKGLVKGKPISRRGRFTDSWVRQNGTWLCVASQNTLISHPAE
jgi:ketosteroid isomerase-like protein